MLSINGTATNDNSQTNGVGGGVVGGGGVTGASVIGVGGVVGGGVTVTGGPVGTTVQSLYDFYKIPVVVDGVTGKAGITLITSDGKSVTDASAALQEMVWK